MQLHDDELSHQLTDGAAAPQSDGRRHSPTTTTGTSVVGTSAVGTSTVGTSTTGASTTGASTTGTSVARTVTDAPHPAITTSPIRHAVRTIGADPITAPSGDRPYGSPLNLDLVAPIVRPPNHTLVVDAPVCPAVWVRGAP